MTPRNPSRAPDAPEPDSQGPVRTCVGCRGRASRSVLVRVVLAGKHVVADKYASRPGRGAWLHPTPDCLALAVQRRAFDRAFSVNGLDTSTLVLEQ